MHEIRKDSAPGVWLASLGEGPGKEAVRLGRKGEELHPRVIAGLGRKLSLYSAGDSPSCAGNEGGTRGALFDGLLYNRVELSLQLFGSRSSAASNADVVLEGYGRWGQEILERIRGVFALIIWDDDRDTLLCARDAVGFYPLFYAEVGHEIFFSTSIDALLAHPDVPDKVSLPIAANYLRHIYPSIEETFFAKIKRVPSGNFMNITRGTRQVKRYWDPFPSGAGVEWVGEDEVARFDFLMNQAVTRCLDLGPAGIFLSGGLDSVTVAAVAAERSRDRGMPDPLGLSLLFPHPECNEETTQKAVAKALGLQHVMVSVDEAAGPLGLILGAIRMSSTWPTPLQSVWNPLYYRLALDGKRRGCRVILTGGGGDEWLTVDPLYAADLFREMNFPGLLRLLNSFQRSYQLSLPSLVRNVLWNNGVMPLLSEAWAGSPFREPLREWMWKHLPETMRRRRLRHEQRSKAIIPSWVIPSGALCLEADRHAERNREPELAAGRKEGGFYLRMARRFIDHPLLTIEMEESFETSLRTGVPLHMPFWDRDLIDLLYRIPPDSLNKGGRSKGLVREMLARRFPDLGFERQKKVFSLNFFTSRTSRESRSAWKAIGGAPTLGGLGIIDSGLFESILFGNGADRKTQDAQWTWDVLNLEMWLRGKLSGKNEEVPVDFPRKDFRKKFSCKTS
ncbi:MAG: hypothetical protein CVU57_29325 [Deltaproteobacteria bacterium HGW-Deltaproteobacteria-15]|jgi:asparagine synthase (glutamine-hydrolysing)|nr:MAG: hypothetical protein CVU57_29325 [Deltaproteobacteria bacterium HGW-Deltaproteobacteria-15]